MASLILGKVEAVVAATKNARRSHENTARLGDTSSEDVL